MDLRGFGRGLGLGHGGGGGGHHGGGNMTNSTGLPGLEPIIALVGARNPIVQVIMVLHQTIGTRLGLDPTMFLTLLGFLWASQRMWRQLFGGASSFVSSYLTSSIHVASSDEIYLHLMKWLASQPNLVNSRALTAETLSKTAWEEGEDETSGALGATARAISADGGGVYLNFSNQEAMMPPRFVPALGVHRFWFEGTYFWLNRTQEQFMEDGANGSGATFKDREKLVISCLGRSPDPIKRMLQRAKQNYYTDHHAKTTVKRPSAAGTRRFGRGAWMQVAQRPVRPMKTVVLDAMQKVQVLADINEYLHPATPRWYANRGIPLRRGYLFHGPPGTGKTSLSFALAGVFGLDIFVISLLEPTLTEEDLVALFNSLPRRCVVLLEDIDTAGLTRPQEEGGKEEAAGGSEKTAADGLAKTNGEVRVDGEQPSRDLTRRRGGGGGGARGEDRDWKVSDLARELRKPFMDDKKGISLSGLLNAIDGVASHEGRVLIMTTNKPETLDDALIRPGRVDLQVAFTNATREQARELFERMYEADSTRQQQQQQDGAARGKSAAENGRVDVSNANGHAKKGEADGYVDVDGNKESQAERAPDGAMPAREALGDHRLDLTFDELKGIAREFGEVIPDGQFSPAELQGFLLKRKKDPRRALEEARPWVEAMLQQKASRTKILQVQ